MKSSSSHPSLSLLGRTRVLRTVLLTPRYWTISFLLWAVATSAMAFDSWDGLWSGVTNRISGSCTSTFDKEISSLSISVMGNKVRGTGQRLSGSHYSGDVAFGISGTIDSDGVLLDGATVDYSAHWLLRGPHIFGAETGQQSGSSVSISADGDTIAVGAPSGSYEINGVARYNGHVQIYDLEESGWTQRGDNINGEGEYDQSGHAVSLSDDGNTVAIGAPYNDDFDFLESPGHVRVYDWTGSAWTQRGGDIDGQGPEANIGYSVSLSADGDTVAMGGYENDFEEPEYSDGRVMVYDWTGSVWRQRGTDIGPQPNGENFYYATSLSDDGNTVAVGAGDDGIDYIGRTRIFDWNGNTWMQRGNFIEGEAPDDESGSAVSLSGDGNTIAISAPWNDGSEYAAGHVRIFDWDGAAWIQRGDDIDGEAEWDFSGESVEISDDGDAVAIGATGNIGRDESNGGHVRIFDWDGSAWRQRGWDVDGYQEGLGTAVSFSSNGDTVAVGGPWFGPGHVMVLHSNWGTASLTGQFSDQTVSFNGTISYNHAISNELVFSCEETMVLSRETYYWPGAHPELWGGTATTTAGPAICLGKSADIRFVVDHRPGETNPASTDLVGHSEVLGFARNPDQRNSIDISGATGAMVAERLTQANLSSRGGRFSGAVLLGDFVRPAHGESPNHRWNRYFTADFINGVTHYNGEVVSEYLGVSGANSFFTWQGCTGTLELERLFPKTRPTVASRSLIVVENQPKTFTVTTSDADGDFLLPLPHTFASKGTETPLSEGVWLYTPDTNATGSDVFKFRMTDLQEQSTVATINVTIEPDFDGDGVSNPNDSDDDNDGMPDIFESENGLDSLNASDAAEDADGDGYTNLEEFEGESDPQDASSRPPSPLGWLPILIFD